MLVAFVRFIPLFVIHVWHPRFPLNAIKKYFTWWWLVLASSQWGHRLSFGLVLVSVVVFSVSLFLPWQEQTNALSTLFTTLILLRLAMTSWATLWRHLKVCCCDFLSVWLFVCLLLLLFWGVRLSLYTMTGTKLADTRWRLFHGHPWVDT